MLTRRLHVQSHTQFTHAHGLQVVGLEEDVVLIQPLEIFSIDEVIAGDAMEMLAEFTRRREVVHVNESGRGHAQVQVGLLAWTEGDRNHAVVERTPELLGDIVCTCLRFEGEIEHGEMRSVDFTGLVLQARRLVLADARAEGVNGKVGLQLFEVVESTFRLAIGDEPERVLGSIAIVDQPVIFQAEIVDEDISMGE